MIRTKLLTSCSLIMSFTGLIAVPSAFGYPSKRTFLSIRETADEVSQEERNSRRSDTDGIDFRADRCTDFSGKWEGGCTTGADEWEPERREFVQNGCESIENRDDSADNIALNFGKPTIFEMGDNDSIGVMTAAWNDSQRNLSFMYSFTFSGQSSLNVFSGIGKTEMWRSGNTLYTRDLPGSELHTPFSVLPIDFEQTNCVFQLVQE